MIYKNSFLNSMTENLKRRYWTLALTFVGFFLYYPIVTMLFLLSSDGTADDDMLLEFSEYLTANLVWVLVTIAALIFACQGYGYLQNKRKLDFYQSVPVNMNKRFWAIYINGILMFLVVYVTQIGISVLMLTIDYAKGLPVGIINCIIISVIQNTVVFLVVYNIAILAMMLTGNIIVALIGTVILGTYEAIVRGLVLSLMSAYFVSYCSQADDSIMRSHTSPWMSMFGIMEGEYSEKIGVYTASLLVIALVGLGLALIAYKYRRVDKCNKAVVFNKLKPVLKFAIIIPLSIGIGMIFEMVSSSTVGLFTGIIIGVIIAHMIFEVVYEADIKAISKNWIHMGIAGAVSILIVLSFVFDIYGFDSYVANPKFIESFAIDMNEHNNRIEDMETGEYIREREYIHANMEIKDIDLIKRLAELSNDNGGQYGKYITVSYKTKFGGTKYRSMWVDEKSEEAREILGDIYATDEYKNTIYQVLDTHKDAIDRDKIDSIRIEGRYYSAYVEDIEEFLEVYTEELRTLTMEERDNREMIVGVVSITAVIDAENAYAKYNLYSGSYQRNINWEYPIYESFKRTRKYLENNDILPEDIIIEDILYAELIAEGTNNPIELTTEEVEAMLPYAVSLEFDDGTIEKEMGVDAGTLVIRYVSEDDYGTFCDMQTILCIDSSYYPERIKEMVGITE